MPMRKKTCCQLDLQLFRVSGVIASELLVDRLEQVDIEIWGWNSYLPCQMMIGKNDIKMAVKEKLIVEGNLHYEMVVNNNCYSPAL